MLLLSGDVIPHRLDLRKPDGENAVAILPREIVEVGAFGFQPERRPALDLLDHLRRFAGARQSREDMNVVFHAADDDGLAIEIGQDAAEVAVQFLAERFVAEQRATFFGRENRMHKNLCERLRHGWMMPNPGR